MTTQKKYCQESLSKLDVLTTPYDTGRATCRSEWQQAGIDVLTANELLVLVGMTATASSKSAALQQLTCKQKRPVQNLSPI